MELNSMETLRMVNEILKEVVPTKVVEAVTLDTSLNEELAIDSIEMMDVLIKIRETLTEKLHIEGEFNTDRIFEFLLKCQNGESITVRSLCNLVEEYL